MATAYLALDSDGEEVARGDLEEVAAAVYHHLGTMQGAAVQVYRADAEDRAEVLDIFGPGQTPALSSRWIAAHIRKADREEATDGDG